MHFPTCVSKIRHIAHRERNGSKGQALRAKQFQEGGQSPDNDWKVVKKLHVTFHEKQRQELAR